MLGGSGIARCLQAQPHILVGERQRLQLVSQPPIPLTGALVGDPHQVLAHPTRALFLVSDRQPPGLYIFSGEGRLLRRVGFRGEGPGEFVAPPQITVWGDTLLLRGGLRNRVAAYRISDGSLLRDPFLPSLPAALQHWLLYRQQLILYWATRRRPALVEVFDLNAQQFTHALSLPVLTEAHETLLGYYASGGLTLLGDSLVLATLADTPTIYYLDLRTGEQGVWRNLEDAAFQVRPPPDLEELLRQGRWKAYREQWVGYLTTNSRTRGLFVLQDRYLVVQLEHGQGQEKRWLRLLVIDPATRQEIDRITFPLALRQQYNLHYSSFATARGACLYLKRFLEEQDRWALWPWCLEAVPSGGPP